MNGFEDRNGPMLVDEGKKLGLRLLTIYAVWLLDIIGLKGPARRLFSRLAEPGDPPYVVYTASDSLIASGQVEKAKDLLLRSMEKKPTIRCGRLLIHILIRQGDYQKAFSIARSLCEREPDNPWPLLLKGDIQRYFLKDPLGSFETYSKSLEIAMKRRYGVNPLKVALKRVCKALEEMGQEDLLIVRLLEFLKLESSNFHDHEFDLLARGLLKKGRREEAQHVLSLGIKAYPKSGLLRDTWEDLGFGSKKDLPPVPVRGRGTPDTVELRPVKTRLLLEGDDPIRIVEEYAREVSPGDTVTLSSCVAGLMEGRIFMEGSVGPGFLAKTLSRFVDQKNVPFGGAAPMANPLSMQVLLEEIGTLRTLIAAAAGALGKALGRKGWFYVVAGKEAGQIDDVLGSLPPYDYYVIKGPKDPGRLSDEIARRLGCHAAIVDANDLGVAWAVGHSKGLDPGWLEEVMSQNPAGNQEQQTPLVIVRRGTGSLSRQAQLQ